MPESKKRKKEKPIFVAPPQQTKEENYQKESSKAWVITMLAFMLIGLFWLVVTYLSGGAWFNLGNANLIVGFSFILIGLVMTMRWK